MMTREEKLQMLHGLSVRAYPTVATMDMGIEYDFVTGTGAGTGFGNMGSWPVYRFAPMEKARWEAVCAAVRDGSVSREDLRGTGLDRLAEDAGISGEAEPVSSVLGGLTALREAPEKAFYCLFDAESGEEAPQFFPSLEALEEAFAQRYCTSLTPWEDMSDEEMDEWIDRLSDDLEELAAEDTADE